MEVVNVKLENIQGTKFLSYRKSETRDCIDFRLSAHVIETESDRFLYRKRKALEVAHASLNKEVFLLPVTGHQVINLTVDSELEGLYFLKDDELKELQSAGNYSIKFES